MANQRNVEQGSECDDSRSGHERGAYGFCRFCGCNVIKYVAKCPATGRHLRDATAEEIAAYNSQPGPGAPGSFRREAFRKAVLVREVLIDTYTGPGIWFGGAGF